MMKIHLTLLLFLPSIIYARVLPAYDNGADKRIDDKKAAGSQEFLSAFLGNVKGDDGSDDKGFSALNDLKDDGKDSSNYEETSYGYDGPSYSEPGYGGYDYEPSYDDGYASGYDDDEIERMSRSYKASVNCREFHHESALTPQQCHNVKLRDYSSDYDPSNPNELAYCRWDMGFDDYEKQAGCLCPRTKDKCQKKHQCYWYRSKHSDDGDCVHNSERFYNILANLLSKRGKKDFALKIKYSSAAAKGRLPHGPWGPAYFDLDYEPYIHPQVDPLYTGNPFMNSYDMPPAHGDGYMQPVSQMYGYQGQHDSLMGPAQGYGDYRMPNSYNQHLPYPAQIHPQLPYTPGFGNSPYANPQVNPFDSSGIIAAPYQGHIQQVPTGQLGVGPIDVRPNTGYDAAPVGTTNSYYNNVQQVAPQSPTPNPYSTPITAGGLPSVPVGSAPEQSNLQLSSPTAPHSVHSGNHVHSIPSGYGQTVNPGNFHAPNSGYGQAYNPAQLHNHVQPTGQYQYGY